MAKNKLTIQPKLETPAQIWERYGLTAIKTALAIAVEEEDYETAAVLRDALKIGLRDIT